MASGPRVPADFRPTWLPGDEKHLARDRLLVCNLPDHLPEKRPLPTSKLMKASVQVSRGGSDTSAP